MKKILLLVLLMPLSALAQNAAPVVHFQTGGPAGAIAWGGMAVTVGPPVQGAPYSATIVQKTAQTLADGSPISETSTGSAARDSQGRTREEAPMPSVDDPLAHPGHLVFLQDPVANASYILDLTNKTAERAPLPPPPPNADSEAIAGLFVQSGTAVPEEIGNVAFLEATEGQVTVSGKSSDPHVHSENLGSKTMEGVLVSGVRTTHTIPAGEIGNARPIDVVSEVWTSPELKTVIYSKLTDPRTGEHIFQLTNLVRNEPDPSLFLVPADFKIVDGPDTIGVSSDESSVSLDQATN